MIILGVKYVWSSYSNCYRALQYKRATAANLKKNIGDVESIIGVFLCEQWFLSPKFGDAESAGDALKFKLQM